MQVVEVVTCIGASVIDVHHVRPRASPRATWALGTVAVVALGAAIAMFLVGLDIAAANQRAYDLVVRLRHAPVWSLRPAGTSRAVDAAFVASLLLAIGAAVAALSRAARAGGGVIPTLRCEGIVTYHVTRVAAPIRVTWRSAPIERRILQYFVASLAVHVALVLILPRLTNESSLAVELAVARRTQTRHVPLDAASQVGSPGTAGDERDESDHETDQIHQETDVARGMAASLALGGGRIARARRRPIARPSSEAFLPGAAFQASTRFAALLGATDLAGGFTDAPLHGIDGSEAGQGAFGMGRRGTACTACDPVMSPSSGLVVPDVDEDAAWRTAFGSAPHRTHITIICRMESKTAAVSAGIDAEIIRRYLRRSIDRITSCYERALLGDEGLEGTVTAAFLIAASGSVLSASASGMPAIDACVAQAILRVEFPATRGGRPVQVNYPFTFRAARAR